MWNKLKDLLIKYCYNVHKNMPSSSKLTILQLLLHTLSLIFLFDFEEHFQKIPSNTHNGNIDNFYQITSKLYSFFTGRSIENLPIFPWLLALVSLGALLTRGSSKGAFLYAIQRSFQYQIISVWSRYLKSSSSSFLKFVVCFALVLTIVETFILKHLAPLSILSSPTQGVKIPLRNILQVVLKIILFFSIIVQQTKSSVIFISILVILIHFYYLVSLLMMKVGRKNQIIQIVQYCSWIFILCFYFSLVSYQAGILTTNNIQIIIAVLFIWCSISYMKILDHLRNSLLYSQIERINSEGDAFSYINLLHNYFSPRNNQQNKTVLLSLVRTHKIECLDLTCFCKQSSKTSEKNVTEESNFQSELISKFIAKQLSSLATKFPSMDMSILCVAFELETSKTPSIFYSKLSPSSLPKSMSLVQLFQIYLLKMKSHEIFVSKSIPQNGSHVAEKVITQQQINKETYTLIELSIQSLKNLYKKNIRNYCVLSMLKNDLDTVCKALGRMEQIVDEGNKNNILCAEFIVVVGFFYRCVIQHSWRTKKIVGEIQHIYEKQNLIQMNMEVFEISLYGDYGAVIVTSIENKSFGKIVQVSENASKIFKYPNKQSMIGSQVQKLIINFYKKQYKYFVEVLLKNTEKSAMQNFTNIFLLDCSGTVSQFSMIPTLTLVKNQIFLCFCLKKMEKSNIVLVFGDAIVGVGEQMQNILKEVEGVNAQEVFVQWKKIINKFNSLSQQDSQLEYSQQSKITVQTILVPKVSNPKASSVCINDPDKQNCFRLNNIKTLRSRLEIQKKTQGSIEYYVIRYLKTIKAETKKQITHPHIKNSNGSSISSAQLTPLTRWGVSHDKQPEQPIGGSSSSALADGQYSMVKVMGSVSERFNKGDPKFNIFINVSIIIALIVCAIQSFILFYQPIIFETGVKSFGEVVFADCAVSDNMQLLEIVYNKLITIQLYCVQGQYVVYGKQECRFARDDAYNTYKTLQTYISNDLKQMMEKQTFFGNKFYEYLVHDAQIGLGDGKFTVTSLQFMQKYVHATKEILMELETETQPKKNMKILRKLEKDWQQLKRISEDFLVFYKNIGAKQLDITFFLVILISVLLCSLSCFLMFLQLKVCQRVRETIQNAVVIYRIITASCGENLWRYYQWLQKNVRQRKNAYSLAKIQGWRSQNMYIHNNGEKIGKQQPNCSSTLINFKSYTLYLQKSLIVVFCVLFVFMTLLALYLTIFDQGYWETTMNSMTQLIISENIALENYFQTKAYFFVNNNSIPKQEFLESIRIKMQRDDVRFVKNAMQTSFLFQTSGNILGTTFRQALINDICTLAEQLMTQWEKNTCRGQMSMKLLQSGILSTMAFFERVIFQSLFDLQDEANPSNYFKNVDFENLQKYLIFNFRMFQLTQARIIQGNNFTITSRAAAFYFYVYIHFSFLLFGVGVWLLTKKRKQKNIAKAFGYLLIFPTDLVKESKFIQQTITNFL